MWHLAINSLAGRTGRNVLLVLAVTLATTLTVAGGAVLTSLENAARRRFAEVSGLADLRIQHAFNARLDSGLLDQVRSWPQVVLATGRFETGVSMRSTRTRKYAVPLAIGIEPGTDEAFNPGRLVEGAPIRGAGQIVIDERLRDELDAHIGDELVAAATGGRRAFKVVGIVERPRLSVLQEPEVLISIDEARAVAGIRHQLDTIEIRLREGLDPELAAAEMAPELPDQAVFRTPASCSAGINRYLLNLKIILFAVLLLIHLSAAILILTTLTTAVTQRQRELAILRCIGTARWQIAGSQLLAAAILTSAAVVAGTPLGLVTAYGLCERFSAYLGAPFEPSTARTAAAAVCAVLAGLVGAAYPSALAAGVRPLWALTARARPPGGRHVIMCVVFGALAIATQPVAWLLPIDPLSLFWFYACAGLPLLFVGFFLLSVPVLVLLVHVLGPILKTALGLPGALLGQAVLATPMRHGFTGAALMVGLAMIVSVWSTGRSIMSDYLFKTKMPDAFAHSYRAFTPQQEAAIRRVPAVTGSCATGAFDVEASGVHLGIAGLTPTRIQFVTFESESFFPMVDLNWVEGDELSARASLRKGRAILIAREFQVARGLGVGDSLRMGTGAGPGEGPGKGWVDFEVAGVIESPSLNLAVHYFGIHRNYVNEALGSVFGTRRDAARYFGMGASNLMLLSLRDDTDPREAMAQIWQAVPGVNTGSSREIIDRINGALRRLLVLTGALAIACLLIASAAVANLIAANLGARRFEYGVLRAVGTPRGLLARLVVGETLLVSLTGCMVGTGLGMELALLNRVLRNRLFGIVYELQVPWDVLAVGWLVVVVLALFAAAPSIVRLILTKPRVLLAAGQGARRGKGRGKGDERRGNGMRENRGELHA